MNEDALYWMDLVEKELLKTGRLEEMDVRHEAVRCAVYRFTCKLLGVSSFSFSQTVRILRFCLFSYRVLRYHISALTTGFGGPSSRL